MFRGPLTLLIALSASSCGAWAPAPSGAPHVVVVIVDTLRADRLGTYGHHAQASPNIDAMASGGVRFARTIAQAPWTRPSIGSMLTSMYPRDLGLYEEKNQILDDSFTVMSESFRDAGYRTVGVTANPNLNTNFGFHQGFDVYVDSGAVWNWMDAEDEQTRAPKSGLDPAPERFRQVLKALDAESPEEAAKPHFVLVDVMEVHEWRKPETIRPSFRRSFRGQQDGAYLRTIRQVDHDVGGFLQGLTERPGWEDTVVVLVSDHGEGLESHPSVPRTTFHGNVLYSSQLEVPWILWASNSGRLPRGTVVERPVRMLDMMPTVLDLVGLDPVPNVRGVSVLPWIHNQGVELGLPPVFVSETRFRGANKVAAYGPNWKLIRNRDGQRGVNRVELQAYGEPEDGRLTDQGKGHPGVVASLQKYIDVWEADHERRRPTAGVETTDAQREQLEALGYLQ